jgi:hypothetical protein
MLLIHEYNRIWLIATHRFGLGEQSVPHHVYPEWVEIAIPHLTHLGIQCRKHVYAKDSVEMLTLNVQKHGSWQ